MQKESCGMKREHYGTLVQDITGLHLVGGPERAHDIQYVDFEVRVYGHNFLGMHGNSVQYVHFEIKFMSCQWSVGLAYTPGRGDHEF